jgi:histidinol-phosphate aminotransferase
MEGVEVIPSQSNFVLFRTGLEPALLMSRLAESGVLVRNVGGYPELRGYLRVNAGTEAENNAFLVALKHALMSYR